MDLRLLIHIYLHARMHNLVVRKELMMQKKEEEKKILETVSGTGAYVERFAFDNSRKRSGGRGGTLITSVCPTYTVLGTF